MGEPRDDDGNVLLIETDVVMVECHGCDWLVDWSFAIRLTFRGIDSLPSREWSRNSTRKTTMASSQLRRGKFSGGWIVAVGVGCHPERCGPTRPCGSMHSLTSTALKFKAGRQFRNVKNWKTWKFKMESSTVDLRMAQRERENDVCKFQVATNHRLGWVPNIHTQTQTQTHTHTHFLFHIIDGY